MSRTLYRPDIDGLRALAVLAVIFCHSGFTWASGGYVGVDVFFVISGFLITRLIRRELKESRFSFSGFYLRRIRRLMPALCFTLVVTLAVGCILSHPIRLDSIGWSTIWATIPASNIQFWSVSGYFNPAVETNPLLHTWSLAVEEQFYLLWPAIAVLLLTRTSRRTTLFALGSLGLLSWIAAELLITNSPTLAFYWMPFRICEFVVGALLVWSEDWKPRRSWQEFGYIIEFTTICGCCILYDRQTRFPGSHAMLVAWEPDSSSSSEARHGPHRSSTIESHAASD
jgi:peptidoglycan/LPS O-acetylase OafA/YrhL